MSTIFYQIFIFHHMIARQKLWKMFFVSTKKLFPFLRYWSICISVFPFFLSVSHCFRGCSKTNLKVYGVINRLNNNLIIHFVWYLEKENRYDMKLCPIIEHEIRNTFIKKSCRKCAPKASTRSPFNFGK